MLIISRITYFGVLSLIVNQPLVNFVSDHDDVMLLAERRYLLQLLPVENLETQK